MYQFVLFNLKFESLISKKVKDNYFTILNINILIFLTSNTNIYHYIIKIM